MGGTMPGRKRIGAEMHPVHRIISVLMVIVILWVVISALYGVVQRRFIETVTIDSETYDLVLNGYGFVMPSTEVVKVNHAGDVVAKVAPGQRVGRGQMVATLEYATDKGKKKAEELLAPHAGLLFYKSDGYQGVDSIKKVRGLDLKHIYENSQGKQKTVSDHSVSKDEPAFVIVDNMRSVKLVFQFRGKPKGFFEEPGDVFLIRFPEENVRTAATVEEIALGKEDSYVLCDIGPMPDHFLKRRVVSGQAYRTELTTLTLDKASIIYKEDQPGVYTRNRGIVTWQPVKILKRKGDKVITETLPKGTTIITTPHRVREGDILK